MEFRVLGPVEVRNESGVVVLPPQQQTLLAMLLCSANAVTSIDRMVEALWEDRPPATSVKSIRVKIHNLRRRLGDYGRISHQPNGYMLIVKPGELDEERFAQLVAEGRDAWSAGRIERTAELLREALSLWRGQPYAGQEWVTGVAGVASRLAEEWQTAKEELIAADLALGQQADVVGELFNLVKQFPFRETVRGQLMVALYRLGRQRDALEVYREGKELLADELGLDPSRQLRELEQAILSKDPSLETPSGGPPLSRVPAELPPDITGFVGRPEQIAHLLATLSGTATPPMPPGAARAAGGAGPFRSSTVTRGRPGARHDLRGTRPPGAFGVLGVPGEASPTPIATVHGPAGSGKSTLAIHVAHRLREAFPDGQLYVDLHGATAETDPLTPLQVLRRWLRTLDVENPPPGDLDIDEAAARFRSLTAPRKMLIVLDNAAGTTQIRPLMPGGTGCAVLVTSRHALSTLDSTADLGLGLLPEHDALAVLERFVKPSRVAAEPAAAQRIVRFCGHLPLALRLAAARLAAHPTETLAAYADRLADTGQRLDELQHADLSYRGTLLPSVDTVRAQTGGAEAARLFQLLGLIDGTDFSVHVAAALANRTVKQTQAAMDQLVEAHLVQTLACGRYRMHDLIRLFAREQLCTAEQRPGHAQIPTSSIPACL